MERPSFSVCVTVSVYAEINGVAFLEERTIILM